ncbi:hypothetical protein MJO28_008348 [Puccinia striiformis f. sp. tritici]|uniref:Uncharacterized protein n=1 Tax=Puccinia striiformis f. sp. tritici TaxID=168172 RepID=A0ACC0ECH2_9BASI|nr:hypothetical protein MJO28_008348 [Puccinia striiformis f. sp. tritici]KAI7952626.1 hypothetical protein MJO29_008257 [Puccinia striiformis f. sp. tritici]
MQKEEYSYDGWGSDPSVEPHHNDLIVNPTVGRRTGRTVPYRKPAGLYSTVMHMHQERPLQLPPDVVFISISIATPRLDGNCHFAKGPAGHKFTWRKEDPIGCGYPAVTNAKKDWRRLEGLSPPDPFARHTVALVTQPDLSHLQNYTMGGHNRAEN